MDETRAAPAGYNRLSPYLSVDGAEAAITFYCSVLGATERMRLPGPGGRIGHAELDFGDTVLMLADESAAAGNRSPRSIGGSPVTICLYVDDVDETHRRALEAGAQEQRAPSDQFYGDRVSGFVDPWGHHWHLATHIEDVSPAELARRAAAGESSGD